MNVTIVFDLDDTLYLERDYVHSGIRAVGHWAETTLGIRGLGKAAAELWASGRRERLFNAALATLGAPHDRQAIAAMVAVYREHLPQIRLAPDAQAFLEAKLGYKLALISDGVSIGQRRKIEALGLHDYGIDPMFCTDEWGRDYWKPHKRAFLAVQEAHRASDRFVYVADNPTKDFLAPRALGWATVQIDRLRAIHPRTPPSDAHRADMTIRSLTQLASARQIEHLFKQAPAGQVAVNP